jgi:hypothetical protein
MSFNLIIILFASWLVSTASVDPAQSSSLGAPGCGPASIKFEVNTDPEQHAVPNPEPEKALVVFLQDDAQFNSTPRPTARFGVDGTWVGATHANSYFYVSVEPGEHHLCTSWQSRVVLTRHSRSIAAAHLTAQAGKTYYFRAQDRVITDFRGTAVSDPEVKLESLDSDEAAVLLRSFVLIRSHAKKRLTVNDNSDCATSTLVVVESTAHLANKITHN